MISRLKEIFFKIRIGFCKKPVTPLSIAALRLNDGNYGARCECLIQVWHHNGQLMVEVTSVDGKKKGLGQWWHENGKLRYEECSRAGEETGMSYCTKEKQQ